MATLARIGGGSSGSGGQNITTPNFSVGADELILIAISQGDSTAVGTVTDNFGDGGTYSVVRHATITTGFTQDLIVWVRSKLTVVNAAANWTYDNAGDPWTGMRIEMYKITGMTLVGSAAIRQQSGENNIASSSTVTPAPTFGSACLTGNVVFGCLTNNTIPSGMSPPASPFTELVDIGSVEPFESVGTSSGFTGSTVTWGNTSPTNFCDIVIELDASAGGTSLTPTVGALTLAGVGPTDVTGTIMIPATP